MEPVGVPGFALLFPAETVSVKAGLLSFICLVKKDELTIPYVKHLEPIFHISVSFIFLNVYIDFTFSASLIRNLTAPQSSQIFRSGIFRLESYMLAQQCNCSKQTIPQSFWVWLRKHFQHGKYVLGSPMCMLPPLLMLLHDRQIKVHRASVSCLAQSKRCLLG